MVSRLLAIFRTSEPIGSLRPIPVLGLGQLSIPQCSGKRALIGSELVLEPRPPHSRDSNRR